MLPSAKLMMFTVKMSTLLHLLHQKKLFERKFVLLFNIFLFFNKSTAILPSSESSMFTVFDIADRATEEQRQGDFAA
jgi:hypothetical protein